LLQALEQEIFFVGGDLAAVNEQTGGLVDREQRCVFVDDFDQRVRRHAAMKAPAPINAAAIAPTGWPPMCGPGACSA